jgi:hypothetical protein
LPLLPPWFPFSPAGFFPDSTTVFTKKGDLLQLGELVMPADAQLRVNSTQVSRQLPDLPHEAVQHCAAFQEV